jgi:Glycosyltransferase sugar-binding region containing DXD motif
MSLSGVQLDIGILNHPEIALGKINYRNSKNNSLLWFVAPPEAGKIRYLGWEDVYMSRFKETHYYTSANNSDIGCKTEYENNPYRNVYVCEVPGYIPARLPLPSSSQKIPRVIFVSWMTRKLSYAQFTSLMAILAHNPEYELIFMIDHEIDQYVCSNYPNYVAQFSKLQAGAARVDVWRMMVMYQYGGVYLDFDNTAIGHIPIQGTESLAATVRCDYTHSTKKVYGILEHWSFAIVPRHPLINRTLEIIKRNILDPTLIESPELISLVDSFTMRLTGPVPFQQAFHELLNEAQCTKVDGWKYCEAVQEPVKWCNITKFEMLFGIVNVLSYNFGQTMLMKVLVKDDFLAALRHYDDKGVRILDHPRADFCSDDSYSRTIAFHASHWNKSVVKKNSGNYDK